MSRTLRNALFGLALAWSAATMAQEHVHEPASPPAASPPAPSQHEHPMPPQPSAQGDDHDAQGSSASNQSELEHVAPDPPSTELNRMSYAEMVEAMAMDDRAAFGKVVFDQFEWRDANGPDPLAWDAQAYYGGDYHKVWFRTEGERAAGTTEDARAEILWDRIFSRWWSSQMGVRHDFGEGTSRDWLAFGVQGLAPYFFDIEATAYVGDGGRTAARLKAEYELLFTQRLFLQPELEVNAYGKDDPGNGIMAGVSDVQLALRLRYEIRREVAPYVGLIWVRRLGKTADLVKASGEEASDLQAVAGVRFWF